MKTKLYTYVVLYQLPAKFVRGNRPDFALKFKARNLADAFNYVSNSNFGFVQEYEFSIMRSFKCTPSFLSGFDEFGFQELF